MFGTEIIVQPVPNAVYLTGSHDETQLPAVGFDVSSLSRGSMLK